MNLQPEPMAAPAARQDDAATTATVSAKWLRWNTWLVAVLLGLQILSAGIGTLVATLNALHDWYMHLVMHALLLTFLLLYLRSHHRRRRVGRVWLIVLNVLLNAFFLVILLDRAQPWRVFSEGQVRWRPDIPAFYVPVALMGLVIAALLVHGFVISGRLQPPRMKKKAESARLMETSAG